MRFGVWLIYGFLQVNSDELHKSWKYNATSEGQDFWAWYCAFPDDIGRQRLIPPLPEEVKAAQPQLRQLLMLTRHGARTPTDSHRTCWQGFDDLYWNCGATEGTSSIVKDGIYEDIDASRDYTFYKSYGDPMVARNVLIGNCQKGQLLAEGAEQLRRVGSVVAAAYFNGTSDPLLNTIQDKIYESPLFVPGDMIVNGTVDLESVLYVRSTDVQRTRLSALNVLSSMFGSMFGGVLANRHDLQLPLVHVLDSEVEYLIAKKSKWSKRMFRSEEYRALVRSHNSVASAVVPHLHPSPADIRGEWPWSEKLFDCMMTAACTEWSHPDRGRRVAPVFQENPELIQSTYRALSEEFAFDAVWQDSVIAKFQSYILTQSLRLSIIRTVCASSTPTELSLPIMLATARKAGITGPEKEIILALKLEHRPFRYTSVHDTTLKPLMGAMGIYDKRVPAYASLLVFEVYEVPSAGYYGIRVVYNSMDVTYRLPGCKPDTICKISSFFEATDWAVEFSELESEEQAILFEKLIYRPFTGGTFGWFVTTSALLLLTAVVSSSAALFCREQFLKRKRRRKAIHQAKVFNEGAYASTMNSKGLLKDV